MIKDPTVSTQTSATFLPSETATFDTNPFTNFDERLSRRLQTPSFAGRNASMIGRDIRDERMF